MSTPITTDNVKKLSEFATATLTDDHLLPVANSSGTTGGKTTVGALSEHVIDNIPVDEEPTPESEKFLRSGVLSSTYGSYESNPEYVYAITDYTKKFIFGIKKDGSVEWALGVPLPIKNLIKEYNNNILQQLSDINEKIGILNNFSIISNKEYVYAIIDNDGKFLWGIKSDGSIEKGVDGDSEREIKNQWYGKKIVWLGTSIPYGQTSETGVPNPMPNPYPTIVGDKLKANVINVARPGMAIETNQDGTRKTYGSLSLSISELSAQGYPTTPYQSYENAMLGHNADLYIFDCEPNNSDGSTSILELFDFANWRYKDGSTFASHRSNYIGALLFLLDKLWNEKPSAVVVFVSEFGYTTISEWNNTYPIREATLAVAAKLKIPVINLWNKLGYNKQNWSLYVNSDHVHPKKAAHERMANILTNELLLLS